MSEPISVEVDSPARIRLVFVVDNMGVGGSELNAIRTAEHLDRDAFDLRVVCFSTDGPLVARYRAIGVPVIHLPIGSLHGPGMATAGIRFVRYLRSERVQIVHAHDMYSNIFAVPWARLARTPAVIASRRWWHSLPSPKLRIGNTIAFRLADAVLANSPQVAESVRCSDGVSPGRIHVVLNFADDAAFRHLSERRREELRAELGLRADHIVIGCVARLVPVKDHVTLIRAFALVHATHRSTQLLIVGDGQSRAALEKLVRDLGLGASVIFAGQRFEGANYHQLCDVSVLASLSEGFPNTLVEAMAAGRAVVATGVGGNGDAVVDGETGILVKAGDVDGFAAAIERLVCSPQTRARMGEAGQARARARYSAKGALTALEAMYRGLLGVPV